MLCRGCCEGLFSDNDCCCFFPPPSGEWSSVRNYSRGDAVTHGDQWYISMVNNNQGNEPSPVSLVWYMYTNCGNNSWNSTQPFGGLGRTPKYYSVSVSQSLYIYYNLPPYGYYTCSKTFTLDSPVICAKMTSYGHTCVWRGFGKFTTETSGSDNGTPFPTGVGRGIVEIWLNLSGLSLAHSFPAVVIQENDEYCDEKALWPHWIDADAELACNTSGSQQFSSNSSGDHGSYNQYATSLAWSPVSSISEISSLLWNAATSYSQYDIVFHGSNWFYAATANQNQEPPSGEGSNSYWVYLEPSMGLET